MKLLRTLLLSSIALLVLALGATSAPEARAGVFDPPVITGGPEEGTTTKSRSADFNVDGLPPPANNTKCQVNDGPEYACMGNQSVINLPDGENRFTAIRYFQGHVIGRTVRSWIVDSTGPTISLTGPAYGTRVIGNSLKWNVTLNELGTAKCTLNGGRFRNPCLGDQLFTNLSPGRYELKVTAVDLIGNERTLQRIVFLDPAPVTMLPDTPTGSGNGPVDGSGQPKPGGDSSAPPNPLPQPPPIYDGRTPVGEVPLASVKLVPAAEKTSSTSTNKRKKYRPARAAIWWTFAPRGRTGTGVTRMLITMLRPNSVVTIRCRFKAKCPLRKQITIRSKKKSRVNVRKYVHAKDWRPGTTLEIKIVNRGYTSRIVRYKMRAGKPPIVSPLYCLPNAKKRPVACS